MIKIINVNEMDGGGAEGEAIRQKLVKLGYGENPTKTKLYHLDFYGQLVGDGIKSHQIVDTWAKDEEDARAQLHKSYERIEQLIITPLDITVEPLSRVEVDEISREDAYFVQRVLKYFFPWLETDEDTNAADQVDQLNFMFERLGRIANNR